MQIVFIFIFTSLLFFWLLESIVFLFIFIQIQIVVFLLSVNYCYLVLHRQNICLCMPQQSSISNIFLQKINKIEDFFLLFIKRENN